MPGLVTRCFELIKFYAEKSKGGEVERADQMRLSSSRNIIYLNHKLYFTSRQKIKRRILPHPTPSPRMEYFVSLI